MSLRNVQVVYRTEMLDSLRDRRTTDRVKLHFEVRKQGNPVDPLKILPRR